MSGQTCKTYIKIIEKLIWVSFTFQKLHLTRKNLDLVGDTYQCQIHCHDPSSYSPWCPCVRPGTKPPHSSHFLWVQYPINTRTWTLLKDMNTSHQWWRDFPAAHSGAASLTAFFVENYLSFELATFIQSNLHLWSEALAGLAAIQKVAHAALLHQLSAGKAGQFTEAIGAVDYGIEGLDLSIPQDKIAVWISKENRMITKQLIHLCFTWLKHIILHMHINAETEMEVDPMLGISNQHI